MTSMRALIVDDERLARDELRRLLQAHPDVVIAGEAANADQAAAQLAAVDVDLLFLDVQMPGGSGFDVLERVSRVPPVIFTTAYDEFAVRAFEVNAFDYLLKPIHPDRLSRALDRLRRAEPPPAASASTPPRHPHDRVFVRDGERCWLVSLPAIALLEAEGNYTRVHFDGNRPLIRAALQSVEERLDSTTFFRVSRTHIVNLRFVERIELTVNDAYVVHLRTGQAVPVSRRHSRRLRDTLSWER
jgi:two-component system LytT family response regulator